MQGARRLPSEQHGSATAASVHGRDLFVCLFIALMLRGIVLWLYADELAHDRDAYLAIARCVAEGKGFVDPDRGTPTAFRPPVFILQVAALSKLMPVAYSVAVINLCWGLVSVWATWRTGQWLGLGIGKTFAALLVAVDPILLQYSAQPMTEVTCAGLVALFIYWLVRSDIRPAWRELGTGLLFGGLVLCRPAFWPFAGLAAGVWGIERWRDHMTTAQPFSSIPWRVFAGVLIVVGPWVIRNQIVMGTPILTTTHGGYTLLLANNPVFYANVVQQGWGTDWPKDSFDRWQEDLQTRLAEELGPDATEQDRDRWQSRMARRFIIENPTAFLEAAIYRVRSLWRTTPQGGVAAVTGSRLVPVVGWYYMVVLVAFGVGLVRAGWQGILSQGSGQSGLWLSLFLIVFTVQAVHLAYWTNARMRAPIVPIISLFAVTAIKRPADLT